MSEQVVEKRGMPGWLIALIVVASIVVLALFGRYIMAAVILVGLWPVYRVFWGGLSFWMRH